MVAGALQSAGRKCRFRVGDAGQHGGAGGAKKMQVIKLLAALVAAFPARSTLPPTPLATRCVSS